MQPPGMLLQQAKPPRTAGTCVAGMQALGASPSTQPEHMHGHCHHMLVRRLVPHPLECGTQGTFLGFFKGCTCGAVAALRAGIHGQVDHGGHAGVKQAQVRRLVVAVVGAAAEQRVRHAERHLRSR